MEQTTYKLQENRRTYRRKKPLLSPIKMIMFAVPFASFAVLDFIFFGQGLWSIIYGCSKVTFPFITLHTQNYPVNQIKSGMNSRELFMKTYGEVYCLGICWFAPFEKILKYTECNVFVLEDVYLRFKGMFDSAFSLYPEKWSRISIITTQRIDYQVYREKQDSIR